MKKIDKQLSYAPAEFQLSYCGWASPAMREMNGIFRQQTAYKIPYYCGMSAFLLLLCRKTDTVPHYSA